MWCYAVFDAAALGRGSNLIASLRKDALKSLLFLIDRRESAPLETPLACTAERQ